MKLLPSPYCLREGAGDRVKEAAIGKIFKEGKLIKLKICVRGEQLFRLI
jgi:hypothetical protein